jgi:hypothetical protein
MEILSRTAARIYNKSNCSAGCRIGEIIMSNDLSLTCHENLCKAGLIAPLLLSSKTVMADQSKEHGWRVTARSIKVESTGPEADKKIGYRND